MTIYTTNNCIFCKNAKDYLIQHNIEYLEINLNTSEKKEEFKKTTGLKTVPQIYDYGNNHIGGYEDLVSYLQKGKSVHG